MGKRLKHAKPVAARAEPDLMGGQRGIAMPETRLRSVREFFEGNPSVRKVAGDAALTAELLLLFRMMLADGEVSEAEMATFRRICADSFGIGANDIEQVTEYLHDFGYETTGRQAAEIFLEMERGRRVLLMTHLIEIARADEELTKREVDLAKRLALLLDLAAANG
jgi:uncharacterized tellurite resistance protein B-like protein